MNDLGTESVEQKILILKSGLETYREDLTGVERFEDLVVLAQDDLDKLSKGLAPGSITQQCARTPPWSLQAALTFHWFRFPVQIPQIL